MNIFKDQDCPYFPVPRALVDSGSLKEFPPSAIKLYLTLLSKAQKHSAVQLELPAYLIADVAGLDAKSVKTAGESLEKHCLITCHKGQNGVPTYRLLNPETGRPIPPPGDRRGIFEHRAKSGRSARTVRAIRAQIPDKTTAACPVRWDEIDREQDTEQGQTDISTTEIFPTDHNTPITENFLSTMGKFPEHVGNISQSDSAQDSEKANLIMSLRSLKQSLKEESLNRGNGENLVLDRSLIGENEGQTNLGEASEDYARLNEPSGRIEKLCARHGFHDDWIVASGVYLCTRCTPEALVL